MIDQREKLLLTPEEAGERLGVGRTQVYDLIELTATGEYVALGDAATSVIAFATRELLAYAPSDPAAAIGIGALATAAKTRRSTAEAAADELVQDGWLIRSGAGKRGSPFVYYLSPKALEDDERAERKPVPTHTLIGDEKVEMLLALQPPGNGQVHDGQLDPMLRAALDAFPGAYVVDGDG